MGKKEKVEEKGSSTGTELLSLKKEKTQKVVGKSSIFSNIKPEGTSKVISPPKVEGEVKPILKGLQDTFIVKETPPIKLEPPKVETIVYEISFMDGKEERVIYSRDLPTVEQKHLLNVVNAFGRSNLRELVLGRREIKISCIGNLDSPNSIIDMRGGVFLKVVAEQDWMEMEYEETKRLFDEAVLKAYREMSAQGITALVQTPTVTPQPLKEQRRNVPDNEENFPVGNIPVTRPPILGDF